MWPSLLPFLLQNLQSFRHLFSFGSLCPSDKFISLHLVCKASFDGHAFFLKTAQCFKTYMCQSVAMGKAVGWPDGRDTLKSTPTFCIYICWRKIARLFTSCCQGCYKPLRSSASVLNFQLAHSVAIRPGTRAAALTSETCFRHKRSTQDYGASALRVGLSFVRPPCGWKPFCIHGYVNGRLSNVDCFKEPTKLTFVYICDHACVENLTQQKMQIIRLLQGVTLHVTL